MRNGIKELWNSRRFNMAGEKVTRRQKDISRLIKERIKVRKDKIKHGKGKGKPGK